VTTPLRKERDRERREQTRAAVLAAAGRVFLSKGYRKTLVSDIADEASVGQGTFYRSFSSKREAFETLFDDFVETLFGEFSVFSSNLPCNVEEYRQASIDAITEVARLLHDNRDLTLLFLREGPAIDREFEGRVDEILDQFALLARTYLDHAIASGFARGCNSAVVSQCLVGMARRQMDVWLRGRISADELEETVREAVDFAFWGFGIQG